MDFLDVSFYYNFYEDLRNAKLDTPRKLIEHYNIFGKNEGRFLNAKAFLKSINFNYENYKFNYKDLQSLNKEKLEKHYIDYGRFENRKFQKKIIFDYDVKLEDKEIQIKYEIIKENKTENFINNRLWAHLHCYDLDKFDEIYGEYINKILKYFSIVITYSISSKIPNLNITILKILNIGRDIGSRFCFTKYINDNKIRYSHCLFLHSKSNKIKRDIYYNNILSNLDKTLKKLNDNLGLITINLLITDEVNWGRNKYHMDNLIKCMNLPNYNFLFSEGNIYIMHYDLVNYIFDNRFDIYKKLNFNNSFDYSWFINYYKCKELNYEEAYEKFCNEKLFGNNFITKLGWYGLANCMIEHAFERIPFGVSKLFEKKIYISKLPEKFNKNINDYIFKNIKIQTKPILLIACHTNNEQKLKYLLHNIYNFRDYVENIYIINSSEYKNIVEPYISKDESFIINNKLNDQQAEIYLNAFADLTVLVKTIDNAKKHYLEFGYQEKDRNNNFREAENKFYNINFLYYDNTHLLCQKKWYDCLLKLDKNNNFILTNDSFVIVNKIKPFFDFCTNNTELEMIGLLDSYQNRYHYPDFLRWYSCDGIKKWINYYENNFNRCKYFTDIIEILEIDSTNITDKKKSLYSMEVDYLKNLHFDDIMNLKYINELNYPIIKLKRLNFTIYENKNELPLDFDFKIYQDLHNDLDHLKNKDDLINHFLEHGINEGRKYKKNQECKYPNFIKKKIENI